MVVSRWRLVLLVSLYMITQIVFLPFVIQANPTTKSIVISLPLPFWNSKGYKFSVGLWCSTFICPQIIHFSMKWAMSHFIHSHYKFFFKYLYIFILPEYIEYSNKWDYTSIISLIFELTRSTRCSLCNCKTNSCTCLD